MKVNANELISRSTQFAARTLTVVSALVFFVDWYQLKPIKWSFLQSDLPIEAYRSAVVALILFGLISLLVNWWGDYVAYTKWFKSNVFAKGTFDDLGSPQANEPPIANILRRIGFLADNSNKLDSALDDIRGIVAERDTDEFEHVCRQAKLAYEKSAEAINSVKRDLETLSLILEEIPGNFRDVDLTAKFTIFVWYLGLPALIAVLTLVSIFC